MEFNNVSNSVVITRMLRKFPCILLTIFILNSILKYMKSSAYSVISNSLNMKLNIKEYEMFLWKKRRFKLAVTKISNSTN